MDREELKKHIVGAFATVPTPFDDDFEVDYGLMASSTEWWVEQGLVTGKAVIKVAAAMGEGPQLRDEEWPRLLDTVVKAAKGRASVVCGIHYKDTIRAIEDIRRAQDLGAIGVQVSPPIFNDPNLDDIVRYYGALSDAVEIGILVYPTPRQHCGIIPAETFERMVDFEHVVGVKWNPGGGDYDAIYKLAGVFNIIDNTGQPIRSHKLGGRGFISLTSDVHPPFDLRVWELMEDGDYETAQAEWDRVNGPLDEFYSRFIERSGGQGRTKKALMTAMGRSFGATRPPSLPATDEEVEELRELLRGFGWPVPEASLSRG